MLKLTSIICPNGLGHFRRSIEVLSCLARLENKLEVSIVCEAWQRERMQGWDSLQQLEGRCRWVHGVLHPSITWSKSQDPYSDGRLLSWIQRLKSLTDISDADLVVSDNMVGVLQLRSDAVLMGSFLWSDVLEVAYPDDRRVGEFVRHERELLEMHKPSMLCVGAMAMPGVLARTRAVALPWMFPNRRPPPDSSADCSRIAVLIGDTPALDEAAADLVSKLVDSGRRIALPDRLLGNFNHPSVTRFDFSRRAFSSCSAVVCRPGMGVIQECIFHEVPMGVLTETLNAEMAFNASRIEALGLGRQLGNIPNVLNPETSRLVIEHLDEFSASGELPVIHQRMADLPGGGVEKAARWLQGRLSSVGG